MYTHTVKVRQANIQYTYVVGLLIRSDGFHHGLQTPDKEIALTARPKIKSQSQIFRYGQSIFCLPHRPKISDFFDLCLHWVSVVRDLKHHHVV